MKLDQLRILVAVLEHGSFSRAADDLGVSQSTVSFHVAALETEAECQLLQRGHGAVSATSQGAVLLRYAHRMLALEREARASLREVSADPSGHLVVAASTIAAAHLLPAILLAYRRACPRVSVALEVSDSRLALDALRAERCELALVGAPAKNRRYHSVNCATDEIVLVGPPKGARRLASAAALATLPLVLRDRGSGTRSAIADFLTEADLDRPNVITLGSTEAARQAVLAGLGYTFISRRAIQADVRARRLRIVTLPGTPVARSFHVVRLGSRTPSPAAQALHELIVDSASPRPLA